MTISELIKQLQLAPDPDDDVCVHTLDNDMRDINTVELDGEVGAIITLK